MRSLDKNGCNDPCCKTWKSHLASQKTNIPIGINDPEIVDAIYGLKAVVSLR